MTSQYAHRFPDRPTAHDALGISVVELSPERCILECEVGPKTHQPFGLLHGGVSALMVEGAASMGGIVSVPEDQVCVGTELNISHLRAVDSGKIRATATPIRKGRTVHVWNVDLTNESGELFATGRMTLQVIKAR
jgi:uncharacterized protein (TIGR00369 family)